MDILRGACHRRCNALRNSQRISNSDWPPLDLRGNISRINLGGRIPYMNSFCPRPTCPRPAMLVFLVLLLSVLAVAQTDRGAITGTVMDPANAVVPHAIIS